MIVCLCEGLSDRTLRRHVAEGARSVRALGQATGAGTRCGACVCDLRRLVQAEPDGAGATSTAVLLRR